MTSISPRPLALATLALILSVGLTPLSFAATPADTLVIARNTDDALTLDPAAAFEVSTGDLVSNLYQRLFRNDPGQPSGLAGEIAQDWSFSPDGQTLTVQIKRGLVFASGNPLQADDVVYSLRRAVKLQKSPSFMLAGLGWTPDNVDALVRSGPGGSVELRTPQRLAPDYVRSLLSTSVAAIVDRQLLAQHEKDGDFGNTWLTSHSAGSSAYVLANWKPREAIVLQAAPHYAGTPAHLKRIVVRHVGDPASQRLLLEKGDVDVASNLTADQLPPLKANPKLRIVQQASGTVFYVGLGQNHPALVKPEVQQALRYLIDYDGIAGKLLQGQLSVNQGIIGQGLPAALPDQPFRFDPAKARALLAQAGYPPGSLSLDFDVPTLSPYNEIGQALVQSFAAGGVQLKLRSADIKQVLTLYRKRQTSLIVFSFVPDYADPHASLDFFVSNPDNSDASATKSIAWRLHWQDPAYNQAIADARQELDPGKRNQIYIDLQKKLRAASPFVLAFQGRETTGLSAAVQGYAKPAVTENVSFADLSKHP
ncbi:MAG: ABC transporter substrate-binding protein [Comamonas sp.]